MTIEQRIEAHCRAAFASWDGYDYHGERRQHFSEAQREHWRRIYAEVVEVHDRAEEMRP